jgi:hypothetical protein
VPLTPPALANAAVARGTAVPCRAAVATAAKTDRENGRLPLLLVAILSGASLFLGMLIASGVWRRLGVAQLTRDPEGLAKPPLVVFLLLAGLGLVGALLVGYGTSTIKDRSWLHTVVFAGILSLTVYVIVDLEFPRYGLIRADAAAEVLNDLRKSMR